MFESKECSWKSTREDQLSDEVLCSNRAIERQDVMCMEALATESRRTKLTRIRHCCQRERRFMVVHR
jgi:hypothetical protein